MMGETANQVKVAGNGTPSAREKTLATQILDVSQLVGEILLLIFKIFYYIGLSIYRAIVPVPEKSVQGERVLVTGAGHGIGKELALLYAKEGATVITWDINQQNNEATCKKIADLGYRKAHPYTVDVANREDVLKNAKKVEEEVGEVTILINNAGIMPTRPFLEITTDEILRIMKINVFAHFWALQAFLPSMKKNNQGHIVSLSSMAGLMGFSNLVPYCASKFAVRGMLQALHDELNENPKNNIKLTVIMPYMVDTGLCVNPVIKFDKLMPLLKPSEVAEQIMHAQRTDLIELTVPRYMYNLFNCARSLPIKACLYAKKFLGSGILPD